MIDDKNPEASERTRDQLCADQADDWADQHKLFDEMADRLDRADLLRLAALDPPPHLAVWREAQQVMRTRRQVFHAAVDAAFERANADSELQLEVMLRKVYGVTCH